MKRLFYAVAFLVALAGRSFAGDFVVLSEYVQPIEEAVSEISSDVAAVGTTVNTLTQAVDSVEGNIEAVSNALDGAISGHISDTGNPHGVTAAQAGALPLTGGGIIDGSLYVRRTNYASGKLSYGWNATNTGTYAFAGGESPKAAGQDSVALGYYPEATGFGAVATGGRTLASGSYAVAAGRYSHATNDRAYVWQGSDANTIYGSHGDGTWNINPNGGFDGAYVGNTKVSSYVNSKISPVSGRVSGLEWATYERYVKWSTTNLSESAVNRVPTDDWPAANIVVTIAMQTMTNLSIGIPGGWWPDNDCKVTFRILRATSSGSIRAYIGTNSVYAAVTNGNGNRYDYTFRWVADAGVWTVTRNTLGYVNCVFDADGNPNEFGFPEDDEFMPVIDGTDDPRAFSPSQAPLSPAEQLNLPDGVVVTPVSDRPDVILDEEVKQEEQKEVVEEKSDPDDLVEDDEKTEPEVELEK